ncbi:MAG TPA: hypothetical protein VJA21_10285 [Verrucomicrobiae bacterium]
MDDGRFFSATNFPDLGYIALKPDLVVTNLAEVYPARAANFSIMVDPSTKNQTTVPRKVFPSLTVQLIPEDGKKFTALTEKALDRRLLIMLGSNVLAAPEILIPIETSGFSVDFTNATEMKKAEDDLKKLVQHPAR